MILFINTSQVDLIGLKLIKDGKILSQLENRQPYRQSELLLTMIDKLFRNSKLKIVDPRPTSLGLGNLTAVAVVSGPGAFSALRLGVATANALAWGLKIPIVELTAAEVKNQKLLIKNLNLKIKKTGLKFKAIKPKYGREPNITKVKK
jgi:tRNA A37 threonylcarbamoyladenosine modification protein TsaB